MSPATAERARLARADIDWGRLYREGFRLQVGAGELPEVSSFVAPFDHGREVIVLLIPCRKSMTGPVRDLLLQAAGMARNGLGLWTWLQQLGRQP